MNESGGAPEGVSFTPSFLQLSLGVLGFLLEEGDPVF